jgi:NAD(P)-dependent dehydrogenase (short-subunit alcohol dehydrogenase family)
MKKTIFISGTSSGLGKGLAKYFASAGWNVAATMRTPEKETALTTIENVQVFKMDVTNTDSVKTAVDAAVAAFGKIDVVVNNAGVANYGALELVTEGDIDQQWNTNVRGVINVIRAVMPHYRANKGGMFINVGSAMGLATAVPLISLYNMSKFALEGLTEALYYEMKPLNIDIRMIEPGGFSSEFNNNIKFNRNPEITGYEAITDKMENFMNNYDKLPLGTMSEIIDVIDALATKKSEQFRTVIGEAANGLIGARNATSIEDFMQASLQQFS